VFIGKSVELGTRGTHILPHEEKPLRLGTVEFEKDLRSIFGGIRVHFSLSLEESGTLIEHSAKSDVVSLSYDVNCTPKGITIEPGEPYSTAGK
jgi:hypothetical protein